MVWSSADDGFRAAKWSPCTRVERPPLNEDAKWAKVEAAVAIEEPCEGEANSITPLTDSRKVL